MCALTICSAHPNGRVQFCGDRKRHSGGWPGLDLHGHDLGTLEERLAKH